MVIHVACGRVVVLPDEPGVVVWHWAVGEGEVEGGNVVALSKGSGIKQEIHEHASLRSSVQHALRGPKNVMIFNCFNLNFEVVCYLNGAHAMSGISAGFLGLEGMGILKNEYLLGGTTIVKVIVTFSSGNSSRYFLGNLNGT